MKGVVIGSLIGAIVMFFWGFLFWGALPVADRLLMPTSDSLAEAVSQLPQDGVYMVPNYDLQDTNTEEFNRRHEAGPIATIFVRKQGQPAQAPSVFIWGIIHMFASILVMAIALKLAALGSFGARVGLVFLAGGAATLLTDIGAIIWWLHPGAFHGANFAYHTVAWLLAGLILARFVRPASAA